MYFILIAIILACGWVPVIIALSQYPVTIELFILYISFLFLYTHFSLVLMRGD